MALPDDLKTKLSIDDDLASSPKEALSRVSADRVAMRNKNLKSGMSHSYSTKGDKHLSNKLTRLAVNDRSSNGQAPDSPAVNRAVVAQLSEQISIMSERMDVFTSRIEELNTKLSTQKPSFSQQNLTLGEACNGSTPTSLFVSGLENGTLKQSSSSSQLNKDTPFVEEVMGIARGQRQIMHQLDNLSSLLHSYIEELTRQRTNARGRVLDLDGIGSQVLFTVAVAGTGLLLFKGLYRN